MIVSITPLRRTATSERRSFNIFLGCNWDLIISGGIREIRWYSKSVMYNKIKTLRLGLRKSWLKFPFGLALVAYVRGYQIG